MNIQHVIAANFTQDYILSDLEDGFKRLGFLKNTVVQAPYNQLLQQLSDPNSLFKTNKNGCNIILLRFEEWCFYQKHKKKSDDFYQTIVELLEEFVLLLKKAILDGGAHYIVCFCPASAKIKKNHGKQLELLEKKVVNYLFDLNVDIVLSRIFQQTKGVDLDKNSDQYQLAHIPFSKRGFKMIANELLKALVRHLIPERKVIVVDCDDTLWVGECATLDPSDIKFQAHHRLLQEFLLKQVSHGKVLCLCSQNRESDVWAVFDKNPEMIIKKEHISAAEINWDMKSEGLKSLSRKLGLDLESFVFIDNELFQCEEVRSKLPQVAVLQFLSDEKEGRSFFQSTWVLEQKNSSQNFVKDDSRTLQYQQHFQREALKNRSTSHLEFLENLKLKVEPKVIASAELGRVSELTYRVNQFNFTTIRRDRATLSKLMKEGLSGVAFSAKDRFGDYGLIGVILYRIENSALEIDSFLLSCRALGRGIEFEMLKHIADIAREKNILHIQLPFFENEKNHPAKLFLTSLPVDEEKEIFFEGREGVLSFFSAEKLSKISWRASFSEDQSTSNFSSKASRSSFDINRIIRYFLEVQNEVEESFISEETNNRYFEREDITDKIPRLFQSILRLKQLSLEESLFSMGVTSLQVIELIAQIHKEVGIRLTFQEMYRAKNIQDLLEQIQQKLKANQVDISDIKMIDDGVKDIPASFNQESLLFLESVEKKLWHYNMQYSFSLAGDFNLDAFEYSINQMVFRHYVFRTRFIKKEAGYIQALFSHTPIRIKAELLENTSRESITKIIEKGFKTPFDLKKDVLLRACVFKIDHFEHLLVLTMPHIVFDVLSAGVFFDELSQLYNAYINEAGYPLEVLKYQYKDFAVWQREWLSQSAKIKAQEDFWAEKLKDSSELMFPLDKPRPNIVSHEGKQVDFIIPKRLSKKIFLFCQENQLTFFAVLYSAFVMVLHRYTGEEDILLGVPSSGRQHHEFASLVGFFVNPIVIRTQLSEDDTLLDVIEKNALFISEALDNQDLPFNRLVERLNIQRHVNKHSLFQISFTTKKEVAKQLKLSGLKTAEYIKGHNAARIDLSCEITPKEDQYEGVFIYNPDLFFCETIETIVHCFLCCLSEIVKDPQQKVYEFSLVKENDEKILLNELKETTLIHRQYEETVLIQPDKIAFLSDDEGVSYRELNAKANQLARYLQAFGVRPGSAVALLLNRSNNAILSILACLKVGAFYVPVETRHPDSYWHVILSDIKPALIVVDDEEVLKAVEKTDRSLLALQNSEETLGEYSSSNLSYQGNSEDIAYVIYTSGSSGRPKGVCVTHNNVMSLLTSTQATFQFSADDVGVLFHSYAFDFSVWEMWSILLYGGKLIIPSYQTIRSPDLFYQLLLKQNVTVLNQTPSAFLNLNHYEEKKLGDEGSRLNLRLIIFGGEAFLPEYLRNWYKRHNPEKCVLYNMFGITECTIHSTIKRIIPGYKMKAFSNIGEGLPGMNVIVADVKGRLLPPGIIGEIWISGTGVAKEYFNRPELMCEKFIVKKYSDFTLRWYKTGDCARYLHDGSIEYLGRIDNQIKLRGYRIERDEIKHHLLAIPGVNRALVVLEDNGLQEKQISAYLLCYKKINSQEIREALKKKLPSYMVPTDIFIVDDFPLTVNGKIDIKALTTMKNKNAIHDEDKNIAQKKQENNIELHITTIWESVLEKKISDVNLNFFDLGGHSLLIAKLHSHLSKELNISLPIVSLLQYPTIKSFSEYLSKEKDVLRSE